MQTTEFKASNGLEVDVDVHGCVTVVGINALRDESQALREFFRHERDEELGRWRWPEDPRYVVYPNKVEPNRGRVVNEHTGRVRDVTATEGSRGRFNATQYLVALREYLATRPAPKPAWHDAKPGEVWSVRQATAGDVKAIVTDADYRGVRGGTLNFVYHSEGLGGTDSFRVTNEGITAGHRIWPEA